MNEISVYILSVAGVTILSTLVDLVLPSGNLNKFLKGIMAIVVVFVIVSPLPKLFKNLNFNNEINFLETQSVLDVVKEQQMSQTKKSLEKGLFDLGFENIELLIVGDFENEKLKISTIFVDLSNLVLTEESSHIFNNEAVEDFLLKQTGLKAGQVVFYE